MRKLIVSLMVGMLLAGSVLTASAMNENRGGFMGFVAGCCFGIRSASAYNDGKDIHWREWIRFAGFPAIWDGIDGAYGVTTADNAKGYGSEFY